MPISVALSRIKPALIAGALVALGVAGRWARPRIFTIVTPIVVLLATAAAWAAWSPEQALRVASAYVSRTVCSGSAP